MSTAHVLGMVTLCVSLTASCEPKKDNNEPPEDTAIVDTTDVDDGFEDGGGTNDQQPGDDCSGVEGILDCNLECWVDEARSYLGDGVCDQGARGPHFDCPGLERDRGDCVVADDSAGEDGTSASGGDESGSASDSDGGSNVDPDTGESGASEGTTDAGDEGGGTASSGGDESDPTGEDSGAGSDGVGSGGEDGGTATGGTGDASGGASGEPSDEEECPDSEIADCDARCWSAEDFSEAIADDGCSDGSMGGPNLNCFTYAYDFGECEEPPA